MSEQEKCEFDIFLFKVFQNCFASSTELTRLSFSNLKYCSLLRLNVALNLFLASLNLSKIALSFVTLKIFNHLYFSFFALSQSLSYQTGCFLPLSLKLLVLKLEAHFCNIVVSLSTTRSIICLFATRDKSDKEFSFVSVSSFCIFSGNASSPLLEYLTWSMAEGVHYYSWDQRANHEIF